MKSVFEAEGEIREVDPLAALVTCWREKTSGALRFSRGAAECGFDLEEGEVVGVVSSDPRFETAAILVRAGKLSADAMDRLAAQGNDAALAALQTGLLTRREWKWGEKIRAIEVLSDLLAWNDGRYRFDPLTRPAGGDFRLPVPRLLLELFLRSRDRNLVDHQLGPPDQTLVQSERFDAEFPSFGLTADAESVVRLIDGRSTAGEIAERAPADEFAVRKLLAALVTLGLVHPVPPPPARPAEREPERAPEPEVRPPTEESAAAETREGIEAPPEPPPFREPQFEAELPAAFPSGPEREMVELPSAAASPLDRFEAPSPEPGFDEAATPPPSRPADLWEPTTEAPLPEPPAKRRPGALLVGVIGILLAAVAAVLFLRARGGAPAQAGSAAARPTTMPAVTFPPPATAARVETAGARPAAVGTAAPAALAPTSAPPRAAEPAPAARRAEKPAARPGASPAGKAAPAVKPSPAPAGASAEPAADSREAWARRAERDRRRLDSQRGTRYAIQLELVCEVASLQEAWRHDRGKAMWLLPVIHDGRDCFRVFWGRYPSIEAARKAKAGIPSYFTTSRNRPAVVAVR
ncbi:MAG: DUF4388 domain-containing protein [Acidobacteriota bacterium]